MPPAKCPIFFIIQPRQTGIKAGTTGIDVGQTGMGVGTTGIWLGQTGMSVGTTGISVGTTRIGSCQTGISVGTTGIWLGQTGIDVGTTLNLQKGKGLGSLGSNFHKSLKLKLHYLLKFRRTKTKNAS